MTTTPDPRVTALGAGVERLTRRVATLATDQETLAQAVAALARTKPTQPLVPTLDQQPEAAVVDLLDWLQGVYLQYDGATLAPCWAYHPGVVEELAWLRGAHQVVYAARDWLRVGDWHDRMRPGVVKRIQEALKSCDIANHCPTPEGPTVPLSDALAPIAAARAARTPIPAPTAAQAEQARQITTRRKTNR
jgi:hypothetical protein